MAPPPTSLITASGSVPAGDVFHDNNGKMYQKKNGQYYEITNGGISSQPVTGGTGLMSQSYGNTTPTAASQGGPMDYSQLLPDSQTYQNFTPLSYSQFGAVPSVQAATLTAPNVGHTTPMQAAQQQNVAGPQAASVDQSQMQGALDQYSKLVQQQLAPQFQQQNDALTGQLAQRGIFNTTAAQQLQDNLYGQQSAALASGVSPLVQQFAGAYNSNNQLNAQQQQQANLYGYQGQLSQAQQNATNQQQSNLYNYSGQNDYNTLVANLQQQAGLANQNAYNTANTYNATAYGTVAATDQKNYNDYLNSLMGYQNSLSTGLANGVLSSYNPGLSSNLLTTGLSNAGQAYQGAYNSGAAGTANLASTFGTLGGQIGQGIADRSKPSTANSGGFQDPTGITKFNGAV